jgi:signal transduction histidine kinase
LVDYLAGFAGAYLAPSGIACRFRIPVAFPAIMLPGNVRHELFLIVKETLHNAVQHAGATTVTCHIAFEHPLMMISIADNGAGFDVSAPPDGHGLRNFAE